MEESLQTCLHVPRLLPLCQPKLSHLALHKTWIESTSWTKVFNLHKKNFVISLTKQFRPREGNRNGTNL